jgi:putative peptidoglycan lipid II flippase
MAREGRTSMNLIKGTATVGGMTLISRITGFVRDILIATFLGTGPVADAWVVAFRFPNLFRRFFGEGAFNAAFVPLYAKHLEGEGPEAAKTFAEEAQAGLGSVLLIFSVLMLIVMPWAMLVLAPGFLFEGGEAFTVSEALRRVASGEVPDKYALTVLFTRITLPYLFFVSLVALLSGVLNSLGRFFVAAAAPILLNLILIAALLFLAPHLASPGHALVWGVFVAGAVQLAALVWGCARAGVMPAPRLPVWSPRMRRLVVLGVPGIIAAGITQINIVIGTLIATLEAGAPALLYYADRIYQLPLGMIGVAMGVVLLPDLSRRLRAGDDAGARATQNRGLEFSMLLTVPAAVALTIIPLAVVIVLFEHGAFTRADSQGTAMAVAAFALGLPAFVMIKVFQPGFFAREDTRTPMLYAGAQTVVNIVLSIVLFRAIGFVGIAIATSVGAWVNTLLLALRLRRQGDFRMDARLRARLPRILLASLVMGAALWAVQPYILPYLDVGFWLGIGVLALLVGAGFAIYCAIALAIGAARISELRAALGR